MAAEMARGRLYLTPTSSRVATFTKANSKGPSQFFWYPDRIQWRPHNQSIDLSNKTIINNGVTSPLDFASWYLVARVSSYSAQAENMCRDLSVGSIWSAIWLSPATLGIVNHILLLRQPLCRQIYIRRSVCVTRPALS